LDAILWHDPEISEGLLSRSMKRYRSNMTVPPPDERFLTNVDGYLHGGFVRGIEAAAIHWYQFKSARDFLFYARHALRFGTARFQVCDGEQGEVEVEAYGKRIVLPRVGARGGVGHSEWERVFALAWLLREPRYAQVLCDMGVQVLKPRRGVTSEPFLMHMADALAGFHSARPGWRDVLSRAQDLSRPENLEFAHPEEMQATFVPILSALAALDDRDPDRFNHHLHDATIGHKRRVTEFYPSHGRGYDSLIAWLPLGLACRAFDLGLPVTVRSEYLPDWIVRHEFPQDNP